MLDTRSKILPPGQLPEPKDNLAILTGYFDPLTALHARRLAEYRERHSGLIVVVIDPPDPILPARARAELLAALSSVDHVLIHPAQLPAGVVYDQRELDTERQQQLIQHVRRRHSSALTKSE